MYALQHIFITTQMGEFSRMQWMHFDKWSASQGSLEIRHSTHLQMLSSLEAVTAVIRWTVGLGLHILEKSAQAILAMGPQVQASYASHLHFTTKASDALLVAPSSHSKTVPDSDLSRGPYTNCVPVGVTDAPTNLGRVVMSHPLTDWNPSFLRRPSCSQQSSYCLLLQSGVRVLWPQSGRRRWRLERGWAQTPASMNHV